MSVRRERGSRTALLWQRCGLVRTVVTMVWIATALNATLTVSMTRAA